MGAPKEIIGLVNRFRARYDSYRLPSYDETELRREFIGPFFKALGWDVDNAQDSAELHQDLAREESTRAPDYSFRINGGSKFYVATKQPAVNVCQDVSPAFQLRRYGWSAKLPLSILTDFEEFAVYDCRVRPEKNDKASTARTLLLTFEQYNERWGEIAAIFSLDAIRNGSIDRYAELTKKRRGTAEVDDAFLKEIELWRSELARNLVACNAKLSQREINLAVQKTIDRVIFLRICEERGIEVHGGLQALTSGPNIYPRLCELFRKVGDRDKSVLFHFTKAKQCHEDPDEWTLSLQVDDRVLKDIIRNLYYPESPYEFSVLGSEILGQVYEQFLGKEIRLTKGHQAKVEHKPEVKKAGGVYYTPTFVVDYIVQQTVGKLLEGKTPYEVAARTKITWKPVKGGRPLSVLDPSCGGGAFLIGAYQYLLDWYRDWYIEHDPAKHHYRIYQTRKDQWRLTTAERKRILTDHIYGVDIDVQAVEVTKLSLLLKVLAGENQESLQRQPCLRGERTLPDLAGNIKCGNSLIGSDFYEGKQLDLFDDDALLRINTFDWSGKDGFPEIMQSGGFDAVIGNPPWGAALAQQDKDYLAQAYTCFSGNHDSYLFFIENASQLATNGGLICFVTTDSWIRVPQSQRLRQVVLDTTSVEMLTTLPLKVFPRVSANCIVFLLEKGRQTARCTIRVLLPTSNLSSLRTHDFDDAYEVDTAPWKASVDKQFQLFQKETTLQLIAKLFDFSRPAVDFLDIMQGIVPYSKENHSSEILEGRTFHSNEPLTEAYGPWIKGRQISRYGIQFEANEYLKYGPWLHRPRNPKYFHGRRLLVQEITGGKPPRICACLCEERLYHDPGIIACLSKEGLDIRYLLAIVNSRLMSWYHRFSSPKGTRHTFPKVLIGDLRAFPIRDRGDDSADDHTRYECLIKLVDSCIYSKRS